MEDYVQEVLFTLMALVVVIALAWLFIKALKGFHTSQNGVDRINLLLTLPVGSRERVVVLSYRDSEYLVGITAGGMSLLDKLPKSVSLDSATEEVHSE
ncbi:MAG: flagellar biosynthetic protein FliO [Candidatus Thiodiazotropha sp. DIVDIV]